MKENETKMKTKKPRHHVEALEVFECFSSCVFYVVMICIFENQFSFLVAKVRKILI